MNENIPQRRHRILNMIARGYTIPEMADSLGFSPATINRDIHVMMMIYRARNRPHLVYLGIRLGVVDLHFADE